MTDDQNITHIRGDDLLIPITVTLDQSRTLDGTETWRWVLKTNAEGHALVTKTSGSGISTDSNQPIVTLTPSDFPVGSFPQSTVDKRYVHELQMTKSGKVETITRGTFTLVSDIA